MAQLGLFTAESQPRFTTGTQKGIPIYHISLVREGTMSHYGKMGSSHDAVAILRQYLEGADREHFVVLLLDRKNKIIGINTVSIGSLSASIVHPREVFKAAILANAAAIICGHNHPSGDPTPSPEDKVMTRRLVEAGKLLGIQVLDHVIIGDDRFYSFADDGML